MRKMFLIALNTSNLTIVLAVSGQFVLVGLVILVDNWYLFSGQERHEPTAVPRFSHLGRRC